MPHIQVHPASLQANQAKQLNQTHRQTNNKILKDLLPLLSETPELHRHQAHQFQVGPS
jgi:hypothetical protein